MPARESCRVPARESCGSTVQADVVMRNGRRKADQTTENYEYKEPRQDDDFSNTDPTD